MKKILIISDDHGNKKKLLKILKDNQDVDYKIHLGDLCMDKGLIDDFDVKVIGNNDFFNFPEFKDIEIEGVKILCTHGHLFGSWSKPIDFEKLSLWGKKRGADVVLHGHDHIRQNEVINDILIVNPGSTSLPRRSSEGTYAIMIVDNGQVISTTHIII